ncbi:unnamed protein product [Miscanthus lutarioriparius]|uniref:Uncharacterized protein n=1 Tax=Miscanthus lutarioriparius TaxID=422564 RepID=A0A811SIR0_9POAL|nr:unnamed protein product [Miscanthus lutarioriparius]
MAAYLEPVAAVRDAIAVVKTGLKRKRIAVGSTEQYELKDSYRLGAGAFDFIFKACHHAMDQTIAMKCHSTADGGHTTLLQEARFLEDACCGGTNPFVVGFHDVIRDPVTWEMCLIMDMWPWFSSMPFATEVMPELDMQRYNLLRDLFPETKLSTEGFEGLFVFDIGPRGVRAHQPGSG